MGGVAWTPPIAFSAPKGEHDDCLEKAFGDATPLLAYPPYENVTAAGDLPSGTSVQMNRPRLRRCLRASAHPLVRSAMWLALASVLAYTPAAATPQIAVRPDSLPLVEVPWQQVISIWFTVSNLGTVPLAWTVSDVTNGTENDVAWVTESPRSGTVAPADSEAVEVLFNTTNVAGGKYTIDLRFDSNDPVHPRVVVTSTMIVVVPDGVRSRTFGQVKARYR